MTPFDPAKRCRARSGACQNFVAKKEHPRRICTECAATRKARQAATFALPVCKEPGCRERTGQEHGYCGRHRAIRDARLDAQETERFVEREREDRKERLRNRVRQADTVGDLAEVLILLIDGDQP